MSTEHEFHEAEPEGTGDDPPRPTTITRATRSTWTARRLLRQVWPALRDRERTVLERRFWCEWTLDQVGVELDVTRERVRQIEARALRRLGKALHT